MYFYASYYYQIYQINDSEIFQLKIRILDKNNLFTTLLLTDPQTPARPRGAFPPKTQATKCRTEPCAPKAQNYIGWEGPSDRKSIHWEGHHTEKHGGDIAHTFLMGGTNWVVTTGKCRCSSMLRIQDRTECHKGKELHVYWQRGGGGHHTYFLDEANNWGWEKHIMGGETPHILC